MITDQIRSTQAKLKILKDGYQKLINEIKEAFYEKENYWEENSPRKPKGDKARMSAAYCLAMGKTPRYSFDLRINKAEVWKKEPKQYIEKWFIYDNKFERANGTYPVIVLYKKNIKLLTDICKKMWIKEVSNEKMILGFEDWMKEKSVDHIFQLLEKHMSELVTIVTDKNLYLKDIVVIYPHKIEYFGRY